MGDKDVDALAATSEDNNNCQYGLKVNVDVFMSIVIPISKDQLERIATAVMTGIHDVFPTNITDSEDLILEKKLLKGEEQYTLIKILLWFDFDGKQKECGLKRRNGQNSSLPCTAGSGRKVSAGGLLSKSSNQWWQS
jgi:hypothetical protein